MTRGIESHRAAAWCVAGVASLALLAIATFVWQLGYARDGVAIRTQRLGATPVNLFRPGRSDAAAGPASVVQVLHRVGAGKGQAT